MDLRKITIALSNNTMDDDAITEKQILEGISDLDERQEAWEVVEKILQQKKEWEEYTAIQQKPDVYYVDLVHNRDKAIDRLQRLSTQEEKLETLVTVLRPISDRVARFHKVLENHEEGDGSYADAIRLNQAILKELVVGDAENGTYKPQNESLWKAWKKQYLDGLEPLLSFSYNKNAFTKSNFTATRKTLERQTDACDTCGWAIGFSQPRFRCMDCGEVQCQPCHEHFYDMFHPTCCQENNGLNVVYETMHPSMAQINAAACNNLAQAMHSIMEAWGERPCFCSWDTQKWMSYRQVLEAALQRVAVLRRFEDMAQVMLCFPAGSVNFYLWDIACILVGITSIGIHVPSPPKEDWPVSPRYLVCEKETIRENRDDIPSHLHWINAAVDDNVPPLNAKDLYVPDEPDPEDKIWTKYLTSGTTGTPKLIPESCKQFLDEMFDSYGSKKLQCNVSYLPHCWASDRASVYWSITHGGRVGFAPCNPSLPQIVEAMEAYKPTMTSLLPAVSQFLLSLPNDENGRPPSDLGGRLEYVTIGSAPVPRNMPLEISQRYGIRDVHEGYGITEIGGVATNGWFHSKVVNKVRLRDPQDPTKWLDQKQEGVVGELCIGDFNTGDIVEITNVGRKVRVIGRSSNAASFKLPNGKWCALVDIENEIIRACSDLFDEVMVWCNSSSVLVMVGSTTTPEPDNVALLHEAIKRTRISPEMQPKTLFLTDKALPKTTTMKVQRGKVIQEYQQQADQFKGESDTDSMEKENTDTSKTCSLGIPVIATRVLSYPIDPTKSFVENGGDSMKSMQFLQLVRKEFGVAAVADWRSLLNDPLQGKKEIEEHTCSDPLAFPAPPQPDPLAHYVLLTGATGFLGEHVLHELLEKDPTTVVICLVREISKSKIEANDRVMVLTEIPTNLRYRSVIHCAANVDHIKGFRALKADNVDLTADLLHLQLAPMAYCSTSSTREGMAPFPDGYTQSKWVSEQVVLRSGGKCFWPPLLVWGNSRDWLMRLIKHCLRSGRYPAELGFVVACPVDVAARDLVADRPCSAWDLDLSDLSCGYALKREFCRCPWDPLLPTCKLIPVARPIPLCRC